MIGKITGLSWEV